MAYKYSNRININEYDYSTPVSVPEGEQIGFTVIKSKNGPSKPVFIEGGDLNTFKDIFGEAETTSDITEASSIYEAQRFVSSYSCYVSAPSSVEGYKVGAIKLKNNTLSQVTVVYEEDNGEPTRYTNQLGDADALFIPKYPTTRKLHISAYGSQATRTKEDGTTENEPTRLFVTAWMDGAYHNKNHKYSNIELDLVETTVAEDGSHVGCTEMNDSYYSNNIFICVTKSDVSSVDLTTILPSASISCESDAITTVKTSETDTAWCKTPSFSWTELIGDDGTLNQSELQAINVVFSTETFTGTTSEFFSLGANEDLFTSAFLFNYTPSPSSAEALSFGNRYWNVYNCGFVTLSNGKKIKTNFIGDRAVMQCRINDVKYGGWAPMYLNTSVSSSGIGGQLGVRVDKMQFNLKGSQIEELCKKNYNPVIKDSTYGTMLINQMTCKGGAKTDWSYIGHVASFLQFEKEMLPIMKDQIGKPNNPYYRNLRASQVQRLLDLRTSGEDRIWAEAVVDTSTNDGVNDADNRNNRLFVISVKVKVEVFSEWIVLNFTNVDQATVIG